MTEKEVHFSGKIAQKVIVEKGDKILLVQDPRENKDIWELPGGRMNLGEEPRAAMQREFKEEMGVDINVHEVVHMEQFFQYFDNQHAFTIIYRATLSDEENFKLDENEVSDVNWFSKEEIKELTLYPEHANALDVYFK